MLPRRAAAFALLFILAATTREADFDHVLVDEHLALDGLALLIEGILACFILLGVLLEVDGHRELASAGAQDLLQRLFSLRVQLYRTKLAICGTFGFFLVDWVRLDLNLASDILCRHLVYI